MLERHRHTVLPDRVDFVVFGFPCFELPPFASQSILAAMQCYGLAMTYSFHLSACLRKGVSVRRSITQKKLEINCGRF